MGAKMGQPLQHTTMWVDLTNIRLKEARKIPDIIIYFCGVQEQTKIVHVQDEGHQGGGREEWLGGAWR